MSSSTLSVFNLISAAHSQVLYYSMRKTFYNCISCLLVICILPVRDGWVAFLIFHDLSLGDCGSPLFPSFWDTLRRNFFFVCGRINKSRGWIMSVNVQFYGPMQLQESLMLLGDRCIYRDTFSRMLTNQRYRNHSVLLFNK